MTLPAILTAALAAASIAAPEAEDRPLRTAAFFYEGLKIPQGGSGHKEMRGPDYKETDPMEMPAAAKAGSPRMPGTPAAVSLHPLDLYDTDGNGTISCVEMAQHGRPVVFDSHPAYPYMNDLDGDGRVCAGHLPETSEP